jgi:transcriptional regulator with XRE-family HTH domain
MKYFFRVMNVLHERLRKLRTLKGFTQYDLAQKLGVSASAVGMYEQGRREPDHKMLVKMAKLFDSSVDFLMGADKSTDEPREIDDLVLEFKQSLMQQTGLMFNGVMLDDEDVEKIVDAIKLGVNLAVAKKQKSNQNGSG